MGKQLVQCDDGTLCIQQKEYASAMACIPVSKERRREKESSITENERGQMRAVLGEINWLISGSRPDLAASCSLLQQRVSKAGVGDLIEVNKVVSQVHDHSNTEIKILPIPIQNLEIGVWSDASFANAEAHKSQGGYMVCAVEKGLKENKWSKVSPWRWRSFKQDRQTASTLGAELLTMSRAVAEAKWLRSMWTEMTCPSYTLESDRELTKQTAIVLSIDSRPAYDHLHGQVMTIKDKRLAIEMLLMKQDIGSENVLVKWFPTDLMLVDGLTKLGAPMMLLRRVLREGRVILQENDEMTKWAGKLQKKLKS